MFPVPPAGVSTVASLPEGKYNGDEATHAHFASVRPSPKTTVGGGALVNTRPRENLWLGATVAVSGGPPTVNQASR